MKQHPLSAAFPAMSADDFAALVFDIQANGQREPVMVYEGMVLDGWHRFRACEQVGIEPQKFNFPADKDPVAFVLSHNLHRRHLTPSQRAAAVVACSDWRPRGKAKPETVSGLREADMAKAAGTSDRTIRDAKVAHKAGLGEAVKEGAMTAHEAAKVARGKQAPAPAPAPVAPPAAALEDFGPSEEELAAAEREQAAELAAFHKLVEADDKLAAAVAEVKRLTIMNGVLESRIEGLMNEKNAALQAAKSWQRKAEKAERALKAAA